MKLERSASHFAWNKTELSPRATAVVRHCCGPRAGTSDWQENLRTRGLSGMSVYEHLSVPSPDHRVKINKTSIQLFPTDEVSAEARHRFQRVVRTAIEHDGQVT